MTKQVQMFMIILGVLLGGFALYKSYQTEKEADALADRMDGKADKDGAVSGSEG